MPYSIISKQLFDININDTHLNPKIAIIGISPGGSQFKEYDKALSHEENNRICAFSNGKLNNGQPKETGMRTNLIKMLRCIGVDKFLKIDSCESLWKENFKMAFFTSIFPQPVLETEDEIVKEITDEEYLKSLISEKKDKRKVRFIGSIDYETIKKDPLLNTQFEEFKKGIEKVKDSLEIVIALGRAYEVLKAAKILDGVKIVKIPHPSQINASQINGFCMHADALDALDALKEMYI